MDEDYDLPDTQTQQSQQGIDVEYSLTPPYWGQLEPYISSLEHYDLVGPSVTLGRAPNCDIIFDNCRIPSQEYLLGISKYHCTLTKLEDYVIISDSSKNGTFVNGIPVKNGCRRILENEDLIALGNSKCKTYKFRTLETRSRIYYLPQQMRNTYHVTKLLGQGACGEVRLAYNKETLAKVAMKKIVLGPNGLSSPSKIETEVEILSKLRFRHPNIINMVEIGQSGSEVFMVLEYMSGGQLTDRVLSRPTMSESQVKQLFVQILAGVQFLHANDVTHRDLKPQNILLSSDEENPVVKIADFGLSKIMADLSYMNTVCGTLLFVAPEILQGKQYTNKVDVWSIGVVLYFMLSKTFPFIGGDIDAVKAKMLHGHGINTNCLKEASRPVRDLLRRMLTVNPEARISINGIFDHAWLRSSKRSHGGTLLTSGRKRFQRETTV